MMRYKIKTVFFLLLGISIFSIRCDRSQSGANQKYIIELIGSNFDYATIQSLSKMNGATNEQLYQWKDHLVLYSYFDEVEIFLDKIKTQFPELQVKVYEKPFYIFSKAERCGNSSVASEWKHILLTANLVEDEKMQQEYLEYHRTQFDKWPEIAQGFCNAEFQQLLIYRVGKQLMLVISIPADKTLDELNPKTVENNPRMDDWNLIMGKYQEGIEGADPGEKWVFLDKVEYK